MNHFLRRNLILAIVFITGACVLAVEVAATRILSTYFGSTIYTVSSVISTILAALSIGYYYGGRFADKHPSPKWFYAIILASGLGIIWLQFLIAKVLPGIAPTLDLITGPLYASVVLFLPPSILLGMLSPYTITLQQRANPQLGIGTIAGSVFFWSTFGSIVGSLVTGFGLIPSYGLTTIILGVGLLLLTIGAAGLVLLGLRRKYLATVAAAVLAGLFLAGYLSADTASAQYLYRRDGRYERIGVYDTVYNGRPIRVLEQDRNTESGVYHESDELPFEYTRYYRMFYDLVPRLERVAAIGGGAYTVPKRLIEENDQVRVDVAEIEPALYPLARQYFRLPDSPRLTNHVMDGRRFLYERPGQYDVVFGDAYHSLLSVPSHLTTEEFFHIVRRSLKPDGIFMANVIGSLADETPSFTLSEIKTLRRVFPNSYFFAIDSPNSTRVQNLIFIAVNGDRPLDFAALADANPEVPIYQHARAKQIDISRYDFGPHQVLTDNYAPVDHYAAVMFRRHLPRY